MLLKIGLVALLCVITLQTNVNAQKEEPMEGNVSEFKENTQGSVRHRRWFGYGLGWGYGLRYPMYFPGYPYRPIFNNWWWKKREAQTGKSNNPSVIFLRGEFQFYVSFFL